MLKDNQFHSVPNLSVISNISEESVSINRHRSMNDIPEAIEEDFNIELRNIKGIPKPATKVSSQGFSSQANMSTVAIVPTCQSSMTEHANYVNSVLTSTTNMAIVTKHHVYLIVFNWDIKHHVAG